MNEGVNAARVLMGDSLGFHIIFVMFGLTLPILVSWFEHMGIKRKDPKLINLAKFWSKIMAMLVITGVISGTIIALQMSLVWPGILQFGGEVIGLPFMFETYAFLIEATFLALYMTTWERKKISPRLHNFFGWMTAFGAGLSAYAITSVNGWMNHPSGFDFVNGQIQNVNVAQAMFSDVALITFLHSMPAYFISVALIVAGIYAFKILKSRRKNRNSPAHKLDWFVIQKMMIFSVICFVAILITADATGKYLAKHEPTKLAAIELKYETGEKAPLLIGGVGTENGEIKGPHFEIPQALSLLAGNISSYEVKGLNDFPKEERPPLYLHTLFNIKMTIMNIMVVVIFGFFVLWKWKKEWLTSSWVLFWLSITGILSTIAMELGWMLTEIGRQPWAVRGYVTTSEAFTKTHDVNTFGYLFPLAYVVLGLVTYLAIRKITKDNQLSKGAK